MFAGIISHVYKTDHKCCSCLTALMLFYTVEWSCSRLWWKRNWINVAHDLTLLVSMSSLLERPYSTETNNNIGSNKSCIDGNIKRPCIWKKNPNFCLESNLFFIWSKMVATIIDIYLVLLALSRWRCLNTATIVISTMRTTLAAASGSNIHNARTKKCKKITKKAKINTRIHKCNLTEQKKTRFIPVPQVRIIKYVG